MSPHESIDDLRRAEGKPVSEEGATDRPTVLSLGSINADFLVRVSEAPGGPGSVEASDLLRTSGGKGANVAVIAARLGAPAALLGCVGDDDLAEQALGGPSGAGVDLTGVRRRSASTGYASILVPPDGAKAIVRLPGANDAWADEADAVRRQVLAAPGGSVLVADGEVPPTVVVAALRAARGRGFVTILDPAPPGRIDPTLLQLADHVVPDHREATQLTGADADSDSGAARAAEALRRLGAATAHVKLEGGGCVTVDGSGTTMVRAPNDVDVIDATGAGDAFAGALAWALVHQEPVAEAVRIAVAAATCAVTGYGSQESYPSLPELRAMAARSTVTA